MRPDALARGAGGPVDGPTIVCAQAGNVNTGAFDPLPEIVDAVARRTAAGSTSTAPSGCGRRRRRRCATWSPASAGADSWTTDAHKWLNVPYDSGLVFVRDAAAHHAAMTFSAAYYVETEGGERDAYNWVPESSRRARGFPSTPRFAPGPDGLAELVDRCCALARRMAERLGRGEPRACDDPQRRRPQPGPRPLHADRRGGGPDARPTRSRATSSPGSRPTARAGSAARPGTAWPRCGSRSATGRRRPRTSISRPRRSCAARREAAEALRGRGVCPAR